MMVSTINPCVKTNDEDVSSALWSNICNGDQEALSKLYHVMHPKLMSFGLKQVSNKDLIRDSVQDLFLNIWEHRENLSQVYNVKSYLFLSLKHKIFENLKKQNAHAKRNRSYVENTPNLLDNTYFDLSSFSDEMLVQIRDFIRALNSMSQRQKQIIYLKYYEGLSTQEISTVLNIKPQSVYNYISESMKILNTFHENVSTAI